MSDKSQEKMGYPAGLDQPMTVAHSKKMGYPLETRMNKGFSLKTLNDCDKSSGYSRSPKNTEFVTAKKAMELTGNSWTTTKRHCQEGKFKGAQKTLIGGNESWQIPVASLPSEAQAKYWAELKGNVVAQAMVLAPQPPALPECSLTLTGESVSMIEAYERSPRSNKEKAEKAVAVVRMRNDLVRQGFSIGEAEKAVISALGASRASINRYYAATKGHPESEWLARLAPQYGSGRPPIEFTEEAYQFILGLWLSPSEPPLSALLVTARDLAPSRRWIIPSDDAVRARINKEPRQLVIAGRKGFKALEQSQPPARRNYNIPVNDTWCSDGHRLDFFVKGPDGKPYRPFLIAWCDIRSRAVLGVVVCRDPDAQSVLRAFGMAMRRTGTAPRRAVLDNGMEYAA
ncbi:MAG: muA, partial [Polaromonas sp.]|nr:muA [Polaromonas sp.]